MAINLLDPSLGVQSVLEPLLGEVKLPDAQKLSPGIMPEVSGMTELYHLASLHDRLGDWIAPEIPNDVFLRPDVIGANLDSAFQTLQESRNPDVRRFVREDMAPLMENTELLRAFSSLFLEG